MNRRFHQAMYLPTMPYTTLNHGKPNVPIRVCYAVGWVPGSGDDIIRFQDGSGTGCYTSDRTLTMGRHPALVLDHETSNLLANKPGRKSHGDLHRAEDWRARNRTNMRTPVCWHGTWLVGNQGSCIYVHRWYWWQWWRRAVVCTMIGQAMLDGDQDYCSPHCTFLLPSDSRTTPPGTSCVSANVLNSETR